MRVTGGAGMQSAGSSGQQSAGWGHSRSSFVAPVSHADAHSEAHREGEDEAEQDALVQQFVHAGPLPRVCMRGAGRVHSGVLSRGPVLRGRQRSMRLPSWGLRHHCSARCEFRSLCRPPPHIPRTSGAL